MDVNIMNIFVFKIVLMLTSMPCCANNVRTISVLPFFIVEINAVQLKYSYFKFHEKTANLNTIKTKD